MENSTELIGILQAISIVAKNLAEKLMQIDRNVKKYESYQIDLVERRTKRKGR